jgi:hypothetical protein
MIRLLIPVLFFAIMFAMYKIMKQNPQHTKVEEKKPIDYDGFFKHELCIGSIEKYAKQSGVSVGFVKSVMDKLFTTPIVDQFLSLSDKYRHVLKYENQSLSSDSLDKINRIKEVHQMAVQNIVAFLSVGENYGKLHALIDEAVNIVNPLYATVVSDIHKQKGAELDENIERIKDLA